MSTATIWGRAANKFLVSQETLPTTTWLARPFSSVTYGQERIMGSQEYRSHEIVEDQRSEFAQRFRKSHRVTGL